MNNSLARLMEGIVATLRADVIPHVGDAYARGQAIGVIDVLNNIAPRLDWACGPIAEANAARRATIAEVRTLLPTAPEALSTAAADGGDGLSSDVLLAERDRLDAEIVALVHHAFGPAARGEVEAARARLRRHMHDEAALEMTLTRKPLFAEITKGSG